MAIAFDNFSSGTVPSGGATGTVNLTVNSNSNGVIVAYGVDVSGTLNGPLTFNGSAMTANILATVPGIKIQSYYFIGAPTGVGTILGTFSNNSNGALAAISYTGVNQTTPIAGSFSGSATSVSSGSIVDSTLGVNNLFTGAMGIGIASGTTATGNQRGTISMASSRESMFADSTGGTLRWTFPASNSPTFIGLELGVATPGVGTNLIQSSGTAALGLGSTSVTWAQNTISGHLIVVGVTLTNAATLGTVTSITDSQGNSYTKAVSGTKSSALVSVIDEEIWYAKNITGGAGSVTVNHTIDNCAIFAREYSGFNTLDATGSAVGSSATPNTGTLTTNFPNELIIVSTGDDNIGGGQTYTAGGTYGDMVGTTATLTGVSMEDSLQVGAGVQTGTLTFGNSADWVSLMATFYQVSGAAAPGFITLLGVGQI